jgi:PadR family transcriptional regulator PadR
MATPADLLPSNRNGGTFQKASNRSTVGDKKQDVWQGTLALMVLRTLETMGPLHGYGIARRIEQVSGDSLVVQYGTLYPALLKLEQEGYIASAWGLSENNRKARYYRVTRAGQKHLQREARDWQKTTAILARFLPSEKES